MQGSTGSPTPQPRKPPHPHLFFFPFLIEPLSTSSQTCGLVSHWPCQASAFSSCASKRSSEALLMSRTRAASNANSKAKRAMSLSRDAPGIPSQAPLRHRVDQSPRADEEVPWFATWIPICASKAARGHRSSTELGRTAGPALLRGPGCKRGTTKKKEEKSNSSSSGRRFDGAYKGPGWSLEVRDPADHCRMGSLHAVVRD